MNKKLLIAFDSTQQALRAEMLLEMDNIEIDTRPVPKEITAGCALAIEFPEEDLPLVQRLIQRERLDIRGVYFEKDGSYVTIKNETAD